MFLCRLAVTFGRFPSELREAGTSQDLTDLMAYWQIEPWGAWRDNWHAAQIAALLYNTYRAKKSEPMPLREFMYRDEETKRDDAKRSLAAKALSFIRLNNAKGATYGQ